MDHEQAVQHAAVCLSSAQRQSDVHAHLMDHGFSHEEALRIVQEATDQIRAKADEQRMKRKATYRLVGLALLCAGVGMFVYSYSTAKPGGMYVVPAGLMGYGIYMLATGDYRGPI